MSEQLLFEGNCPRAVARDAKYAIRSGRDGAVVALTYRSEEGERWYATTDAHPRLVAMVNSVKVAVSDQPNGPFYINEYGQVLVPAGPESTYYFAGEYQERLLFEFEGKVLSGDAINLAGRQLTIGEKWTGPKPGIPYVLKAGGKDIYFDVAPRPNVTVTVLLSEESTPARAVDLARQIRAIKGFEGGRFYVNEWCQMFAPVKAGDTYESIYLGHLSLEDGWFRKRGGRRPA